MSVIEHRTRQRKKSSDLSIWAERYADSACLSASARCALRRTTFDDARETRPASRSRERSERLAKVGWEAGIRNQRKQVLQLTDGARVVVTTRSVLATSGHHSSLRESPRILANLPDSWRHCGDATRVLDAPRYVRERPAARNDNPALARVKALAMLDPALAGRRP